MKQVLHVFRAGIAASLCLTVLAACQDGRGQFKSRRSSLAERCEWQKAHGKAVECDGPVADVSADKDHPGWDGVKPERTESLFQKAPVEKKPDSAGNESGEDKGDTNPGSAESHTMTEAKKGPPAEADQYILDRDKLIADTENRLPLEDREVAKLIKGITINGKVDRTEKVVKVDIDAIAVVDGKDRLVNMDPTPIGFSSKSEIKGLVYSLRDEHGEPLEQSPGLKISGTCADPKCTDVRMVMEFQVRDGLLRAVFQLKYVNGDSYKLEKTNLAKNPSEVPSFEVAQTALAKAVAAKTEAGKDSEGKTTVDRTDGKKEEGEKSAGGKEDKIRKNEAQSGGGALDKELPAAPINGVQEKPKKAAEGAEPAKASSPESTAPKASGSSGRDHDLSAQSGGKGLSAALPAASINGAQEKPKKAAEVAPQAARTSAPAPKVAGSSGRPHDLSAQSGGKGLSDALPASSIHSVQPREKKPTAQPAQEAKQDDRRKNQAPSGGKSLDSAYAKPLAGTTESL